MSGSGSGWGVYGRVTVSEWGLFARFRTFHCQSDKLELHSQDLTAGVVRHKNMSTNG